MMDFLDFVQWLNFKFNNDFYQKRILKFTLHYLILIKRIYTTITSYIGKILAIFSNKAKSVLKSVFIDIYRLIECRK